MMPELGDADASCWQVSALLHIQLAPLLQKHWLLLGDCLSTAQRLVYLWFTCGSGSLA
jgi:hypothetical protein